jgi:hypothetical protein
LTFKRSTRVEVSGEVSHSYFRPHLAGGRELVPPRLAALLPERSTHGPTATLFLAP